MTMSKGNIVYLDYQSAKPVDPEVIEVMKPYMVEKFGNASSLHEIGDWSTESLEASRKTYLARLSY